MADFEFYEKDGRKYDRFSNVAEYFQHPDLVKWKIDKGRAISGQISRKALKIGSRVDDLCEQDIKEGAYKLKSKEAPEVLSCMKAWEQWKKDYPDHVIDISDTQNTVFYDDWGVAGTADLVGATRILDVKTSRAVILMYWVQLAFYNRQFKCPEKWVLRLDKSLGEYEYVKCPDEYSQEYLEAVFVGMLNVYKYFKSTEESEL